MIDVTLVQWSDFARNGKSYADRIARGETFLVLRDGQPLALVRPIEPGETFSITTKGDSTT